MLSGMPTGFVASAEKVQGAIGAVAAGRLSKSLRWWAARSVDHGTYVSSERSPQSAYLRGIPEPRQLVTTESGASEMPNARRMPLLIQSLQREMKPAEATGEKGPSRAADAPAYIRLDADADVSGARVTPPSRRRGLRGR